MLGMKRELSSRYEDGGDSDREDDRKRRWMTKEQARACQQKFEEWNGSLRGKQEEVAQFAKGIGLSALQVEKRFHYIRKHYDKVTKRLTTEESSRGRGFELLNSGGGGIFGMCTGSTQIALISRVNEWAQHELDSDRLMKMLIHLASTVRHKETDEVLVRPSRHQITKLEGCKFFDGGVPPHLVVEPASTAAFVDVLQELDLVWLGRRTNPEPFALFMLDSGLANSVSSVTKWVDVRLRGHHLPCFTIVPKGRMKPVKTQIGVPWMQALMTSVPGMGTTRLISEENLEYVLSSDSQVLGNLMGLDALELLYTLSECLVLPQAPPGGMLIADSAGGGGSGHQTVPLIAPLEHPRQAICPETQRSQQSHQQPQIQLQRGQLQQLSPQQQTQPYQQQQQPPQQAYLHQRQQPPPPQSQAPQPQPQPQQAHRHQQQQQQQQQPQQREQQPQQQ